MHKTTRFVILLLLLLLIASGCCLLLLHKPVCDPSPLLSLRLPANIQTLSACPRFETHYTSESGPIKESFNFGPDDWDPTEVELYRNSDTANRDYESRKAFYGDVTPVFREFSTNNWHMAIYYTEKMQSMGYYHAKLIACHGNLLISVRRRPSNPDGDELSLAVRQLADALAKSTAQDNFPIQASQDTSTRAETER